MIKIKIQYIKIILIVLFIFKDGSILFSNGLPVMIDEVIDIQISKLPSVANSSGSPKYQARVSGSYLFTQDKPGTTAMLYPVPINSRNISVKVNGTSCAIEELEFTWQTRLGDYPAFAFTTDPDSLPFKLEVCYTHDIPQNKESRNTFLYPLIFNREDGDTTETSIAFHVTMPKEIAIFKTCLGDEEIKPRIQNGDETKRLSYKFINSNPKYTMDFMVSFSRDMNSHKMAFNHFLEQISLLGRKIMAAVKNAIPLF